MRPRAIRPITTARGRRLDRKSAFPSAGSRNRRRDPFEMFFDRIDICPVARRAMIASLGSLPLPSRSQQPRRDHPRKEPTLTTAWVGAETLPDQTVQSVQSGATHPRPDGSVDPQRTTRSLFELVSTRSACKAFGGNVSACARQSHGEDRTRTTACDGRQWMPTGPNRLKRSIWRDSSSSRRFSRPAKCCKDTAPSFLPTFSGGERPRLTERHPIETEPDIGCRGASSTLRGKR